MHEKAKGNSENMNISKELQQYMSILTGRGISIDYRRKVGKAVMEIIEHQEEEIQKLRRLAVFHGWEFDEEREAKE